MKDVILGSLIRRFIGYLGAAGVVGLENDVAQLGAALAAVGTVAWSIYIKLKAAKS